MIFAKKSSSDQNVIVFSCFFKTAPRDRFYIVLVPIFIENLDLSAIFDFRDLQNGTRTSFSATKAPKEHKFEVGKESVQEATLLFFKPW